MEEERGRSPEVGREELKSAESTRDGNLAAGLFPRPLFAVAVVLICFLLLQACTLVFSLLVGVHYAVAPAFVFGGIVPIFLAARWLTPSVRISLRLSPVRPGPVLFCTVRLSTGSQDDGIRLDDLPLAVSAGYGEPFVGYLLIFDSCQHGDPFAF